MSYTDTPTTFLRLFWIGPTKFPGVWGIDAGMLSPIWFIHQVELWGLVRSDCVASNALHHPNPRAWFVLYPETGIRIESPEGQFTNARIRGEIGNFDPEILDAYRKYARKVAI